MLKCGESTCLALYGLWMVNNTVFILPLAGRCGAWMFLPLLISPCCCTLLGYVGVRYFSALCGTALQAVFLIILLVDLTHYVGRFICGKLPCRSRSTQTKTLAM